MECETREPAPAIPVGRHPHSCADTPQGLDTIPAGDDAAVRAPARAACDLSSGDFTHCERGSSIRNRLEARSRERLAKRLVDQILTADIGNLQTPFDELTNVRDLADPLLRSAFESADDDSPQKLNASLALLDSEPVEQTTYLRKRLPALLPSQVRVVRQALSETSPSRVGRQRSVD